MMKKIVLLIILITLTIVSSCSNNASKQELNKFKQFLNSELHILNLYDTTNTEQSIKDVLIWISVLQQRNEHARAILELQDLKKVDSSYVIDFCMAKSFTELSKDNNALSCLINCLNKKSDFMPALELLVTAYLQTMQLDKAIQTAEFICKLDDSNERQLFLASLYEFNNPDKALVIYEKYYNQIENPEILEKLSIIYQSRNQKNKYLDVKRRIYELNKDNVYSLGNLMDANLRYHEVDAALNLLGDVQNNFNDTIYVQALTLIGQYFIYSQDSVQIRKIEYFINSIIDTKDIDYRLQFLKIYLYNKIEKNEISNKILQNILIENDTNPDKIIDVSTAYFTIKDFDKGLQILNNYENKFPKDWKFPYYTGVAFSLQSKEEDAILPLLRALNIDSNNIEVMVQLANSYDKLNKKQETERIYRKALSIEPNSPIVNNNFAYLLSENPNSLKEALELSSKAIELDSTNYAYIDTYGWILFKMGQSEEALKYLHLASEINYASAEISEHLAEVYFFMEKKQEALYYYKKAYELDSKRLYLNEKILNLEMK